MCEYFIWKIEKKLIIYIVKRMETETVSKRQQLNQTVIKNIFLNNNNDDGQHRLAISMSIFRSPILIEKRW